MAAGTAKRRQGAKARDAAFAPAILAPAILAPTVLAPTVLAWYDRHRRRLPWRALPGERADPYRIWLSEIMLQQTTVAAAAPYFLRFLERWPNVEALAAAPLEEVLSVWAGLGYYARARNLHRCASIVAEELGGRFPQQEEALRSLPGVGDYTAAAIAAIAFDRRTVVLDGNVERVLARLYRVETPLPAAKKELRALAGQVTPERRPGDFAQAMMDLGATLCLPRAPRCSLCPLEARCLARAAGVAETLPRRQPKAERPTRRAVAFLLSDKTGRLLLRRRPAEGLLGAMMEVPSTPWRTARWNAAAAHRHAPAAARWQPLPGKVVQVFTHFRLEVEVWAALLERKAAPEGRWVALEGLAGEALPSVMRKVIAHGLDASARR